MLSLHTLHVNSNSYFYQLSDALHSVLILPCDLSGAVTCIKVRKNDQECVSASSDGTCIIWDLV